MNIVCFKNKVFGNFFKEIFFKLFKLHMLKNINFCDYEVHGLK